MVTKIGFSKGISPRLFVSCQDKEAAIYEFYPEMTADNDREIKAKEYGLTLGFSTVFFREIFDFGFVFLTGLISKFSKV